MKLVSFDDQLDITSYEQKIRKFISIDSLD